MLNSDLIVYTEKKSRYAIFPYPVKHTGQIISYPMALFCMFLPQNDNSISNTYNFAIILPEGKDSSCIFPLRKALEIGHFP